MLDGGRDSGGLFRTRAPRQLRLGTHESIRIVLWAAERTEQEADPKPPPIVLLHGIGDSSDVWRPVLRHWPRPIERATIAFDLPGHGGSRPMPAGGYRQDLVTRRVASVLHEMGVMRPILIGHSHGARIAVGLLKEKIEPALIILIEMSLIDRHPSHAAIAEHIREMAEVAPSKEDIVKRCAQKLPLADADSLREVIEAQAVQHLSGWRLPTDIGALALLDEETVPALWASLCTLSPPTIFIRGAFSALLSRPDLVRLVQAMKGPVTTHEISRAGHAVLIEQPKSVAKILAQATAVR